MVIAMLTAWAGPVVCDPAEALRLLDETGIVAARVPAIAPSLLPGLARAQATGEARSALDVVCEDPTSVSVSTMDRWDDGTANATLFAISTSRVEDCVVRQQTVRLSVGVRGDDPLALRVLPSPPDTLTPVGSCATETTAWRDETVLAGEDGSVRVVLQQDHDDERSSSRIVVRTALATGWREQVLLEPAPERLTGGVRGPEVTLVEGGRPWIVFHHDREADCTPVAGQTVWSLHGDRWKPRTGRDALGRLADRGLWRLAGDPGWFLVVAFDDPSDRALLDARTRKRQHLVDEPLRLRESGAFPLLNAGFLFAAIDPWPTEEQARAAQRAWPRKTGAMVRQGWNVTPRPCTVSGSP